MLRLVLLLILAALSPSATPAVAHNLDTAVLSFEEQTAPGRFLVRWRPTLGLERSAGAGAPTFPPHCRREGPFLECGSAGLHGTVRFPQTSDHTEIVVRATWLNGTQRMAAVGAGETALDLKDVGGAHGSTLAVAVLYGIIGVEHIIFGLDHLLFVMAMVIVVGFRRRLIWTITAFTLAHSLTLGLSVTGLVEPPSGPVEAIIALSILLFAVEALRPDATLTRRIPWLVAFLFGLVHGFGFAGALGEVGLPRGEFAVALLTFNLGVEIGQLLLIAAAYLVTRVALRIGAPLRPAITAVSYLIGAVAAYWCIDRVLAILGPEFVA